MINGVSIKRPHPFKIERYKLSDLERIANGNTVGDFINRKRTFIFTYEAIASNELNVILDIIWETDSMSYTLTYVESNVTKTATVYPGMIPSELHHTGSIWIWKDVEFSLIER